MTGPRVPLRADEDPLDALKAMKTKRTASTEPDPLEQLKATKPVAPEKPSWLDALTASASQGLTMGFGDELIGAANAGLGLLHGDTNIRSNYIAGRDAERARVRQVHDAYPVTSATTELAAGVVPALATGGTSGAMTAGRLLGQGAAYGAVAGLGNAEGSLGRQAAQTVLGAGAGAALGYAGGKVGNAIAERLTGASDATRAAVRKVAEKFDQDQLTASSLAPTIAEAQATGKPVKLIDLGKTNVKQLGRAVADAPGEGQRILRQTLESRIGDPAGLTSSPQALRVKTDVAQGFDVPIGDVDALDNAIVGARSTRAQAAYQRAYARGPVDLPIVRQTFDDPDFGPLFREAHVEGIRQARMNGNPIPVAPDGSVSPTVQTLDYMKRGLDAVIEKKMAGGGMSKNEARLLRGRMNAILTDLDTAVPEYGAARAQYRGDSEMRDALAEGRKLGVRDAEDNIQPLARGAQITQSLANKTPNEQTLYRVGAADRFVRAIDDRADHLDPVGPTAGNDAMRERLLAIAPDQARGDQLLRNLRWEREMRASKDAVVAGSGTSRNMAGLNDAGVPAELVQAGAHAVHGNYVGSLLAALRGAYNARNTAAGLAEREAIAKLLTADPTLLPNVMGAAASLRNGSPLALALARLSGKTAGDATRVLNP